MRAVVARYVGMFAQMLAVGVKGATGAEQILGIVQLGAAAIGNLDLAVLQPLRIEI